MENIKIKSSVNLAYIKSMYWGSELRFFNSILYACTIASTLDVLFEGLKVLFADRRYGTIMHQDPIIFDWGWNEDDTAINIYQKRGDKLEILIEVKK